MTAPGSVRDHAAYLVAWWVLLSAALLAMITGAAMFGPLMRRNRFLAPELAEAVATPAATIALLALVALAALPLPTLAERQGGGVLANITGIVVVLLLGYRLVVGTGDRRGFEPEQLVPATPLLWLALLALAVLAVRLELRRRSAVAAARRPRAGRGRRVSGRARRPATPRP